MARQKTLLKILSKSYKPNSIVDMKYRGQDMTFKTDPEGNAIVMIIGSRLENGNILGDRFVRTLIKSGDGKIIKDQWQLRGIEI